ncbi:MAG: AAA family ATPase [Elusimicrobia bacterium]|nr:AAA family ATPase [Elusimicrobiota bacterium]
MKIAVAGKGGTGKTTFCGLLIRELVASGKTPVLAVDADPNSTLGETLGIEYAATISDCREEIRQEKSIPPGMAKSDYIEMRLNEILVESRGVDLLVMGMPEGRRCYCYVNEILRTYLSRISKSYAHVIMDNEAGMEHLSRRTTDDVDVLFIVSEPTAVSIRSASRVVQASVGIGLNIKKTYLVLNKSRKPVQDREKFRLQGENIETVAAIPYDEILIKNSENGETIFKIPQDAACVPEIKNIIEKLKI